MNILELKDGIQQNSISGFFIFEYSDSSFLPWQYARKIAENKHQIPQIIEDISSLGKKSEDIFNNEETRDFLFVYETDTFDTDSTTLSSENSLIVICKKVAKTSEITYRNSIVKFPKVEPWQIEDFVASTLAGVSIETAKRLASACKSNLFRLDLEMQKIMLLDEKDRNSFCEKILSDGTLSDVAGFEIFSLTNAVTKKDFRNVYESYNQMKICGAEPFAIMIFLCNSFRNIVKVQLAQSPTAESLGMSDGQFKAVKYSCGRYSRDQLMEIYKMLTSLDGRIKKGEFPVDILVDYMITNILSA